MPRRRSGPEVVAAAGDLVVQRDAGRAVRAAAAPRRHGCLATSTSPTRATWSSTTCAGMRDLVEALRARARRPRRRRRRALARALAATDPERRQEVVEVDPEVLAFAREHLGLRRAPGLRVRHGDGRAFLAARRDGSADAILVDAFVGARVPRHLVTAEALADARACRAGRAAVNVIDAPPLNDARAIAAGLLDAFAVVAGLGAGPGPARPPRRQRRAHRRPRPAAARAPALARGRRPLAGGAARPRRRARVRRRHAAVARLTAPPAPAGERRIPRGRR